MEKITAYEGAHGQLHRNEADAIAQIIGDAGQGTINALLKTDDASYQSDVRKAILRAAEMLSKSKRNRKQ